MFVYSLAGIMFGQAAMEMKKSTPPPRLPQSWRVTAARRPDRQKLDCQIILQVKRQREREREM